MILPNWIALEPLTNLTDHKFKCLFMASNSVPLTYIYANISIIFYSCICMSFKIE